MTTTQRSRFVAESCFDYLNLVMADTIFNASERSEVAVSKLEMLGFRVGQKLVERYTVDRLRFNEKIDIIKFICREFWTTLFQKQVDSLRTNRKVSQLLVNANSVGCVCVDRPKISLDNFYVCC